MPATGTSDLKTLGMDCLRGRTCTLAPCSAMPMASHSALCRNRRRLRSLSLRCRGRCNPRLFVFWKAIRAIPSGFVPRGVPTVSDLYDAASAFAPSLSLIRLLRSSALAHDLRNVFSILRVVFLLLFESLGLLRQLESLRERDDTAAGPPPTPVLGAGLATYGLLRLGGE